MKPVFNTVFAAAVMAAVSSVSPAGQSGLPGADAVKALVTRVTAETYTPAKTPWGDPDISGIFTTKDEANTPMERPAEWTGRRMEDITPQEFAAAVKKRQEEAVERAPFAGGGEEEEGVAIAVPIHWFDNLAAKNSRPWFVIDPADGIIPAVKPGVKARPRAGAEFRLVGGRRDTYTDRSLGDRCIAMTWRMPAIYGNSYQILQAANYVVIRREQIHEGRIVPLDGRPHVDSSVRTYEGDSRGHWEGNTLVVETTNYNENLAYRGYAVKNLRVIERFTRTAPNKVEWSTTIDDPMTYTRPWTFSIPMTEDDTQLVYEYACHEGNFGLANLLSAGRTADKKSPAAKHRRRE